MKLPNDRRAFLKSSALIAGASALTSSPMAMSLEPPDEPSPAAELKARLLECLGGDWPDPCELEPRVMREEQRKGYRLLWVDYAVEPGERVPAILMIPDGVTPASPAAGVALWHQHAGKWHLGKTEPAGLAGDRMHHTGVALVRLGYVVLCPDALCFEQRRDPAGRLKGGDYERYEFLRQVVQGRCMAWKNILDMRRAVDYLSARPEVDPKRLGCYGHSMGSTHTWLVGPWEPRLQCLVGNCCLPTYRAIHRRKLLHCFPNFIPGFHQYGGYARYRRPDCPQGAASELWREGCQFAHRGGSPGDGEHRPGLRPGRGRRPLHLVHRTRSRPRLVGEDVAQGP